MEIWRGYNRLFGGGVLVLKMHHLILWGPSESMEIFVIEGSEIFDIHRESTQSSLSLGEGVGAPFLARGWGGLEQL